MTRLTPAPAGSPAANTNGQALPTTIAGTYSYAVTLSDGAGGHTATLTHTYTVGGAPSISGKLVFTRSNRIWSINPDGTGLAQLTGTAADPGTFLDDQPAKSPDGTKVVFARRTTASGPSQLWVIDADGLNPQALTSGTGDNTAPAWSPDGQKIAFQSNRTGLERDRRLGRQLERRPGQPVVQPRRPDERRRRRHDTGVVADERRQAGVCLEPQRPVRHLHDAGRRRQCVGTHE